MTETLAVFQPPMSWLKTDAALNICEPHRSMTHQARNQRDMLRSMLAERRHAPGSRLEARSAAKRAISPHVGMR
jgi:hypothetical protein